MNKLFLKSQLNHSMGESYIKNIRANKDRDIQQECHLTIESWEITIKKKNGNCL